MSALAQETCEPCRGGVPPLPAAEAERLLEEVPHWRLAEDSKRIERHFTFGDFATALNFVIQIGAVAEAAGHHPDLALGWGYVTVSLQTHAIGGLQRADFILAARIEALPRPGERA
jgi:4a-hydroxytetrahydrobiopterin dehydratase